MDALGGATRLSVVIEYSARYYPRHKGLGSSGPPPTLIMNYEFYYYFITIIYIVLYCTVLYCTVL